LCFLFHGSTFQWQWCTNTSYSIIMNVQCHVS
jgi:hypothetical protein